MDKETSDAVQKGLALAWAFGVAAFAGLISYLQTLVGENPQTWKWIVAGTRVLTAGFVGLLTLWLLAGWNLSENFVAFALGVAGYGGVESISFFQSVFRETVRRAAGVKDDETKS